ncbi:MAG TPA: hypothetical protein VFV81_07050, partial [Verrucomicrobiae bacterium]|nr:hypothetical protein [Verrucomicrobiae bacterium]
MKITIQILLGLALGVATPGVAAQLNPLFQDNAVLQCDARVPVWGTARDGEKVTVTFAGQEVSTVASNGVWKVWLSPMKGNAAPQTLTVRGDEVLEITNVLVGEVWVAGGQSNMERQLGLRAGQKPIVNWVQEAAAANYPAIRQFYVPEVKSFTPQTTVKGDWSVCTPQTVTNFTAVGYFFARDLFQARHVPIGIIFSSWGGTPAEAWTSETALQKLPDFSEPLAQLKKFIANPELARRDAQEKQDAWFRGADPGSKPGAAWSAADLDTSDWKMMTLPTYWE